MTSGFLNKKNFSELLRSPKISTKIENCLNIKYYQKTLFKKNFDQSSLTEKKM